ncbi:MAG: calcium/sodium antiporter [Candidatus Thermoplasmatota archaeon]|nr:calcium/sodium antiporter [Candidatus Thermoplasmatota archaeon]
MTNAFVYLIEFMVGLVLLIKGNDIFIDGAAGLAKKLGISEHMIGLTLVAFATSLPELAVSSIASFNREEGIAIGTVVGSNVANICLVLGVAALIMQLKTTRETRRDAIFMTAVAFLLFGSIAIDKRIDRYDSLIFLSIYAFFIYYLYKTHKENNEIRAGQGGYAKETAFVIFGSVGVVLGAHFLVESGAGIAEFFGISQLVIGLSMVAVGTSLPELSSSITAAIKRKHGIAVGNIIGSNIINILLVLGIAGAINPIGAEETLYVTVPFLLFVSLITAFFAGRKIGVKHGVFLLFLYGCFIVSIFL